MPQRTGRFNSARVDDGRPILYNAPAAFQEIPMSRNAIFAGCLLAVLVVPPAASAGHVAGPRTLRIMTTVFPLAEMARAVAGERAEVALLLPPGAEVHTWQASFGDIRKLAAVDAFIQIGSGLEPWAGDLLRGAARPDLRILEIGRTIPLAPIDPGAADEHGHGHGDETTDPHVWLDLGLDAVIVERIAEFLSGLDPENAPEFRTRAAVYEAELERLDKEFRSGLGDCRAKTFIYCGHSAFAYLARRYGLEQVAVFGASPDAAPTPRELAAVIDRAKAAGVRTVFFEPGTGEKMARMIAAGAGADTRPLSAAHNLTSAEIAAGRTFLDIMRTNLENLKHGLACR
jgi:zinc transport system substrate-binding protein